MIGLYIAANVGKYLFRSSAKYGYTGLVGGGLISKAGRGVGMAVRGKYKKLGDAIYDFFNEGGIGHSLLAGSSRKAATVDELRGNIGHLRISKPSMLRQMPELGVDAEFGELLNKAVSSKVRRGTTRLTMSEHRRIIKTLSQVEMEGNLSKIARGKKILDYSPVLQYSRAAVSQHNKRFVKAGIITVGSAYVASMTTRKAFEAAQAVESNAINFAASIGEYEAIRAIPMMNTMQATTERAAALQYIQQSRTNARSLLGQEAALRHGV